MTGMEPGKSVLAVIGTAGRDDDAPKLRAMGRPIYDSMYREVLRAGADWNVRHAVSGGAAWGDHLAVRGFLEGAFDALTLYVPAHWDGRRYIPNERVPSNPGKTSNGYHAEFSRVARLDSLGEIAEAIRRGAKVVVEEGFKRRNLLVARDATHVVALTFGYVRPPVDLLPADEGFGSAATAGVKDGGTAHTWRESWKAQVKRHVAVGWLAAGSPALAGDA